MLSPLTHDDPIQIAAYRLTARLGSGGMGTVYLARSTGGRTVALKTMHSGIASDPASRTRFRLETDAARIIGGHHGATVVDADPFAETPWLATEYVLGPPLDHAVSLAGPLPETSVRALGAALAGALSQLHASEVVHRDLKPSNVMVTAYGPKIIDFGIARAAGDDRLTRTGAAAGTPAFMSPEQATGQEHTPAGDVFALAGVLTYAATGHGPFGSGRPADLLYRVRYADPDLTGVPDALVPILTRCLSKDPTQRPTTNELAAQLHGGHGQFADHLPEVLLAEIARRATEPWQHQPYRLPAPAHVTTADTTPQTPAPSRRKLLKVAGSSILGVAAAGVGTWAWLGPGGKGPKPDANAADQSASVSADPKPDYVWQIQVGRPSDLDLFPASASVPFPVGDQVVLAIGNGFAGIEAATGAAKWTSGELEDNWAVTSDGAQVYRIGELEESVGQAGKVWPLLIESLDLTTGKASKRLPLIQEFNGVIFENQLICTSGGVIYIAAGKGRDKEWPGFDSFQPWSLAAIDIRTGKTLWNHALPRRPDKSDRLHFLAGQVVGNRLILLQETNDGRVQVVAHNRLTGAALWSKPVGAQPEQVRERLTTDDRHVYLGTGPLRALRLTDGGEAWSLAKPRAGTVYGPPAVKNGLVYAVQKGLGVVAVNAMSGTVRWEEKGGEGARADLTERPVVGTKFVYSKGPSGLRAIDMSSRTTAKTYQTVGTRFFGHESANVVIAYGNRFLAAFPLQ
ncbi:protein kinase [Streptomyces sp. NPDC052236]|uniref:protein kinase domain-containing protein n=1 Tax=Streptomyces sp. NPDC052236 TaxID=3365686 RepID=UPI0037D35535